MRFLRANWYNICVLAAVIATIVLAVGWEALLVRQRILIGLFIVMNLHCFEEFGFPGGFPLFANTKLMKSSMPDRYPLNQNTAMIGNCFFIYVIYLIPIFFPDQLWLGLGPVLFGLLEFVVHATYNNYLNRSFYNPGLATTVLGFLPLGVYYIYFIVSNGMGTWVDWVIGYFYPVLAYAILFQVILLRMCASENSPYPFTKKEMERYKPKR
jgi:hypothetical protein